MGGGVVPEGVWVSVVDPTKTLITDSDIIEVLKLKVSYGTNGNSRLGTQEAQGVYSYGDSYNYTMFVF